MDKIDFFGKCSIGKNDMFLIACENGNFYAAKWLYSLGDIDMQKMIVLFFVLVKMDISRLQNGHTL